MVKRIILPARKKLISSVRTLNSKTVSVGYFADQGTHEDSGLSYPALMYIQEVKGVRSKSGLVHRRLFEMTMNSQRTDITQQLRQNVKANFLRRPNKILSLFGQDMQKRLKDGFGDTSLLPANAASTVRSKGKNSPLVDSGSLRDKLTYRVRAKTNE